MSPPSSGPSQSHREHSGSGKSHPEAFTGLELLYRGREWLGAGGDLAEFCSAVLTEQGVGRISRLAVLADLRPLNGSSSWSLLRPGQNRILDRAALQRPVRQNRAIASQKSPNRNRKHEKENLFSRSRGT